MNCPFFLVIERLVVIASLVETAHQGMGELLFKGFVDPLKKKVICSNRYWQLASCIHEKLVSEQLFYAHFHAPVYSSEIAKAT